MVLVDHLKTLWGRVWFIPLLPPLSLPIFALVGGLRIEIILVVVGLTALATINLRTRNFLLAVSPGLFIAIAYEIIRYLRPIFVTPDRVVSCELRTLELNIIPTGGQTTLPEYFAEHHSSVLDVFFAVPYTFFWMIAVVYGVALFFINRRRMSLYLWTLAIAHAIGFVFWLGLPAAPPWYVIANGCAVQFDALPNAAGLARLDELFGISYFEQFYSRAPTVFGAFPSLHVVFPLSGLVAAWASAGWRERALHLFYSAWMLCASVYLVHHWLLDGLASIPIVLVAYFAAKTLFTKYPELIASIGSSKGTS